MPSILTARNARSFICSFVERVYATPIPRLPQTDPVAFFTALKRRPIDGGHYEGLSVFEVANRTLSDLVVLSFAELLLREGLPTHSQAESVKVLLGTEDDGGTDVEAQMVDGQIVLAECFNVAPSFFQAKLNKTRKKLRNLDKLGTQAIAFNHDASGTWRPRPGPIVYVPIDVDAFLARFR